MFVEELYDAYSKYARSLGLKFELLHCSDGHKIAKVSGEKAGQAFKNETGKHVVQRISATEAKGRKHTSIVSVGVMSIKKQTGDEELRDQDLEIIFQTGHGPGGQHQNKTKSMVKMTHTPTGLTVVINGRCQHSNKKEALKVLQERVNQLNSSKIDDNYNESRKELMGDGSRGDKRRTYNFLNSKITDHVLNKHTHNIKGFMNGNFELLFD